MKTIRVLACVALIAMIILAATVYRESSLAIPAIFSASYILSRILTRVDDERRFMRNSTTISYRLKSMAHCYLVFKKTGEFVGIRIMGMRRAETMSARYELVPLALAAKANFMLEMLQALDGMAMGYLTSTGRYQQGNELREFVKYLHLLATNQVRENHGKDDIHPDDPGRA